MLAITVLAASTGNNQSEVNTFYIETQEDFDKYSGTEFSEGSKILFAAGMEFQGEFIIKGSGTKENPNLVVPSFIPPSPCFGFIVFEHFAI